MVRPLTDARRYDTVGLKSSGQDLQVKFIKLVRGRYFLNDNEAQRLTESTSNVDKMRSSALHAGTSSVLTHRTDTSRSKALALLQKNTNFLLADF